MKCASKQIGSRFEELEITSLRECISKKSWDYLEEELDEDQRHRRTWQHGGHPLYTALRDAGAALRKQEEILRKLKGEMSSL